VLNKAMGSSFDHGDMNLLQALSDQAAVTVNIVSLYSEIAEKQRIQQELNLARDFQRLLLPKEDPIINGYDFSGISMAALEVGGDYYDYIEIDEDHMGFCVADVSGKGLPGGLVMSAARSTLRAEARISMSPKEVLTAVNDSILRDTGQNVFVTMTYGILEISTGEIVFARAGHEPTLIIDENPKAEIISHMPDGIALGLVEEDIFRIMEDKTITLENGQMALFYTDGVIEAMNSENDEYGADRFMEVLQTYRLKTCDEIIQAVLDDIAKFAKGIHQHDDITIMAIRKNGNAAKISDEDLAMATPLPLPD